MKRFQFIVLCALLLCGLIAYADYRSGFAWVTRPFISPAQEPPQITDKVRIFVPSGVPLVFSDLKVTKEPTGKGPDENLFAASVRVAGAGAEEVATINLALFEFDGSGALRRVDGWIKDIDPASGRTTQLTLRLDRRSNPETRLILTAERVLGRERQWEMDYTDLARGVAADAAGREHTPFVRQDPPTGNPTGAALCSEAFRRAMELVRAGDGQSVTSFTCDQTERSYRFTFNGKAL